MSEFNGAHADAIAYYVHRCWALEERIVDGNRQNEEQMKLKSFATEGLKLLEDLPGVIATRTGPQANTQVVKTVNVLGALDQPPRGPRTGKGREYTEDELTVNALEAAGADADVLFFAKRYADQHHKCQSTRQKLVLMLDALYIHQAHRPLPPAHGNDL